MLRGVNKQIIEINDTENLFFEKAVLYVRPEYAELSDTKLKDNANDYLLKLASGKPHYSGENVTKCSKKSVKKYNKQKVLFAVLATAGVTIGALVLLIKLL